MVFLFNVIWIVATSLLIFLGIYFSSKLKFLQLNIFKMISSILNKNYKENFKTLFLTLSGKLGIGSILGIIVLINAGGIGSIFWMWVSSFILVIITYVEVIVTDKYKERKKTEVVGGTPYYIKNGLKNKKLANLYVILIFLSYTLGFTALQSNTMTIFTQDLTNFSSLNTGIVIAIAFVLLVIKGQKNLTKIMTSITPFMAVFYLLITITILVFNISSVPNIFKTIVIEAFKIKPLLTGTLATVIVGLQRAIFSTESGLGISTLSYNPQIKPKEQGFIQMFGVYFIVLIVGTLTSIVVLTSDYQNYLFSNSSGIEVLSYSFFYHGGMIGKFSLYIVIMLFAFSTILSAYFYGEKMAMFLFKKVGIIKKMIIILIMVITIIITPSIDSKNIWFIVDMIIGSALIINLYALFKLFKF